MKLLNISSNKIFNFNFFYIFIYRKSFTSIIVSLVRSLILPKSLNEFESLNELKISNEFNWHSTDSIVLTIDSVFRGIFRLNAILNTGTLLTNAEWCVEQKGQECIRQRIRLLFIGLQKAYVLFSRTSGF